jgi:hypothetical protein
MKRSHSKLLANTILTSIQSWLLWIVIGCALLAVPSFAQHLHQLYYDNANWTDSDLTALTGGPVLYPQSIAAFYTTPNDQLHVYYASNVDLDFHVHQLFYNGSSWSDQDLTALTGGSLASNSSGMSGFSIDDAQYVYFCGSDFSVHEYSYGNNGNFNWVDTRLTSGYPEGCDVAPAGLVAFTTATNNTRNVYFHSHLSQKARAIRHLYFNGKVWKNENITAKIKGAEAEPAVYISGFAIGDAQYLYFEATNGHTHEFSFVSSWKDLDVTVASGGVSSGSFEGNGTASFLVPGTHQKEVYYAAGSNQDVHRASFKSSKWKDTDLSSLTGSSGAISLSQIVGFATTPNKQLHIYFSSFGDGLVNQLFYNGSTWADSTLPSAPVIVIGGPTNMAGFAIDNLQRVYYISQN